MRKMARNYFNKNIRYICLIGTIAFGFMTIIGTGGGGGGGDGGSGGNGTVQYVLTANATGQGSVAMHPSGGTYDEGTSVTLTATPDSGWEFSQWSGDVTGTNNPTTVTMDANKTVIATFTEVGAQDTEAPTWPVGTSLTAEDIGATFLTLKWSEAGDNVGVTTYRIFKGQRMEDTVEGDKTSYAVAGLSRDTEYTFRVEAGDAAGNWSEDGISKAATTAADLPQDPKDTAPELSATATTSMSDATVFLYTGTDAIQKGVEPGTIKDWRVAVIRGRVVDENGQPVPDVTVSILGMPELGRTTTRADGAYDLAVNGGGLMKVHFEKEGLLPVKRQLDVPWQNYVHIDDVVMIPRDDKVTPVQLSSTAGAQAAQGSVMTDPDGTRQATLVVPTGVAGELVLPDGTRQSLDTMNVRVTEFTVGDDGPNRMPAEMPSNIAYTYAMDLSSDEDQAAGAEDVEFDKPIYYYVENFLGFPAGIKVPTGYYDEERGVWVASESGLVIKIIDITGSAASVDTDGDDQADDAQTLAGLGFTDEELAKLAELYSPGDTLWRVPISHFSSWDCNFGAWPPEDAKIPWFKPNPKHRPDPCKRAGSIIDTSNMALGETVDIAGLPFGLHYHSNRMPGFANTREIPLRDETAPDSLAGIKVEIEVAGQHHAFDFEADPDPLRDFDSFSFTWDGKDGYGRDVQGSVPMIVKVGYVYDGVYEANDRWGEQPPEGVVATEIASRNQIGLWNSWTVPIGGLDPRAQGLGGWSLGIHHFYDPASQTLYRGDGTQRSAEVLDPIVMTVAGTGEISQSLFTWNHDGEIATEVGLGMVSDTVTGPDGSLYIAEPARGLLRVTPDGIINRVAGGGMDNDSEGINATDALVSPIAIAIGPDESIYISEGDRVRKVGPEGRINTIAGDGDQVYGPEGGPALGAAFEAYKIAMAPDGNLYILDYDACIIRKVDTDGMLRTYAGTEGVCGAYSGEGGRARAATFGLPMSMTLAPEGSLYVADMLANRVLRIAPNGIITTVAGTGNYGNTGDGGPAVDATLLMPMAVDVGPDNSLYIGTADAVRKVGPDGIIVTIAGGTEADSTEDGVPAKRVAFGNIDGVQMGPDKNLYLFEQSRFWVRKIGTSFGVDSGENKISIADKDNEELYVFDGSGRHLRTTDVWSKAVLWEFDYDTDGNLMTIRDVDGDETTIDRDLYGNPTTITPPKAQPSTLAVNPDGYLTSITDPEGNTYQFTYNGDGLLTAMTNPNDHQYVFEYDSQGRLVKDINPAGGFQTLERIRLTEAEGFKVNITTAEGRMTSYETQDLPEGGKKVIKTYPFGLSKQLIWAPDSSQWIQYVDGTEIDFHQGPDPQFGMEIPIPESLTETTPAGLKRETRMAREVQLGTITDSISINDRTYTNTFDELEKRFTLTTPEGRQKTVTLNDQGRVSMMQLNTLAPINFSYNDQGKGETITIGSGSDERSFQFSYDQYGFLSSMTDPLGGMITFQRDLAGRIIGKSMPDGRTITFNYDANGNVTSVTPPGRTGHTLSYTEVDKLSTYDPPNAGFSPDATTFAYNLDGQLTGIVRPGGSSLVIGYDSSGRALSFTHSHGTTIAAYDPNHAQLTTLTTSDGVDTVIQSLTWDGFLMVGESWEGPFSASVEGSHNDLFLVKSMRVSGGAWRNFSYDNDGLMVSAGDLNMVRDENGLITETSIGTVTTKTGYDDFGERVSFISKSGTNPLIEINYVYDKLGRITGKTEVIDGQSTSYQYTYDACGRLTDVDGSSVAHYTYDENSNRTNYTGDLGDAAGAYDSQDRMLSYGDASYTYSASGELLTKTVGTDTTTYGYDSIGNLRTVTIPGGTVIDYLIDGMDRRIGKKINGTLVQGFVYMDLISPVAELDGAGTVVSEFVYGSNMNVPDYMIKGGITYRIISDHLGSPRLVVNITTGAILQRIDYDEFGRVLSDTNLGFQPFGFAGGLYDIDTGLVRFGARDYDPETGRWTTKDPILFSGGDTNLYGYVLADPINFIDPTGYALNRWQDYFNTSQVFVDAVGSVGDACLRSVTFDLFDPGKDIRKAVGVDIVNECSETYIKVGKGADIVLKTVGACSGVSGLREGITTLSKRGAVKYFQDINNTIGFAGGAANSIKTLGQ